MVLISVRFCNRPVSWKQEQRIRKRKAAVLKAGGQDDAYIGTDGRRKATWEEVFKSQDGGVEATEDSGNAPPWTLGWQASEKRLSLNEDLRSRLQLVAPAAMPSAKSCFMSAI